MSQFAKWFKVQFKRLPNSHKLLRLRAERGQLLGRVEFLEGEIDTLEKLQTAWDAAMYTKQAAPSNFSF